MRRARRRESPGLREGDGFQPREVEVGLDNNRMVRILSGLEPGEQVMLAPPIKESKTEERSGEAAPEETEPGGKPSAAEPAPKTPAKDAARPPRAKPPGKTENPAST